MKLRVITKNASLIGVAFLFALVVIFACQAHAQATGAIALNAEDAALVKKSEEDVKNNLNLGGIHARMGLDCTACHGNQSQIPDDRASVENATCVACHGNFDAMDAKTEEGAIHVHGSHLGPEIECTACHQGHQPSEAYCTNCHTNFDLPIPGGKK